MKKCDFISYKKTNLERHFKTKKHLEINCSFLEIQKEPNDLTCEKCKKIFKTSSGLWKHNKRCNNRKNIYSKEQVEKEDIKDLVIQLIKINNEKMDVFINENKELKDIIINQQNQMTEIIPKMGNVTNNTNNNQFNLNFFLNEQCKDAISIGQFVESVQVTMDNLMTTCHQGLGSGLIKLINDNLNKLSIYERPIHCTDKKRETIYIKNGDTWEKDKDKQGMYDLINKIENKQIKQMGLWTDAHPDYLDNEELTGEYMQLINRCTSSIEACRDKVVKYVCLDNFVKE